MELRSAVAFAAITLITFAATTQANEAAKQQAIENAPAIGAAILNWDAAVACSHLVGKCATDRNYGGFHARCIDVYNQARDTFKDPSTASVDALVGITGSKRTWCAVKHWALEGGTSCIDLGNWINAMSPKHTIPNLHARCGW